VASSERPPTAGSRAWTARTHREWLRNSLVHPSGWNSLANLFEASRSVESTSRRVSATSLATSARAHLGEHRGLALPVSPYPRSRPSPAGADLARGCARCTLGALALRDGHRHLLERARRGAAPVAVSLGVAGPPQRVRGSRSAARGGTRG
jgi:hypothetical protein